ncbi:MAG: ABC transporter ATP-binding protein [Methylococcales bacterium]|nr:ABC transporter ATP-binding protein [Methylococcales bacterium]
MTCLVEVTNLHRFYGRNCAVKNLNFNLKKGQIVGFLGINGAGKTTTLQMLCGNLAPSSGTIKIKGIDLVKKPIEAKNHCGYLPETPPLYKNLTVDEFLEYCAQLHRIPNAFISPAIQMVKNRCGLITVSKRLISQLSKGYQQRIGIAQAIIHQPAVIVLDEPMVGLDPLQIKEIRQLLIDLSQYHGIILSSHLLSEVQTFCTDIQIIHQGELVLQQAMNTLTTQSLEDIFLSLTSS